MAPDESNRGTGMRILATVFLACGFVGSAAPARALTIFDNGTPDGQDALFSNVFSDDDGDTDQRIADDFAFAPGAYELKTIEWFGVYAPDSADPPGADAFTIGIHADASGSPGSRFFEYTGSVARMETGQDVIIGDLTLPIYVYVVDIAALVLEGDSSYWLSIHNGAGSEALWFWATSNGGLGDGNANYSNGPDGPWLEVPTGSELAFRLGARPIPEPSAALAFGLGSLVVGGSLHRGRRH
jgi:hypothetical protein